MRIFFFIRDIFRKFRRLFIADILLLGLVSLMEAAAILTIVPVVDLLLRPDLKGVSFITRKAVEIMHYIGIPVTVGNFLVIFLAFNLLSCGVQILVRYFILKVKYAVLRDIVLGTFEDFFRAKWFFFSSHKQGTLLNTFINETRKIGDAFGAMAIFFANLVQLALYLAVPFYLSWQVTSISLLIAFLFACPFGLLGRFSYRFGKLNTSTANHMTAVIQESLSSAKVILGFGNQSENTKMVGNAYDAHRQATLKSQALTFTFPLMYYPLGLLVIVISFFVARKFAVPISETAALLYSLLKVMPTIGKFPELKNTVDNFFPSYEQVLSLRNSAKQLRQKTGKRIYTGFTREIVVKNVSFVYPGYKSTLEDIDATIPKGKTIAFVGKSGVGKTTLIDIVMGFHEPTTGQVFLDSIPLSEFDINSYRKKIGYVPQESILFNLTIKDNLLWANESATDEEVREACRQANADKFIQEFPQGYHTLVGDRGVRLSGGQIQRIALARAILRKPDILILDEATSSIDSHSERSIQQAIDIIAKETTIIIIAHRLSTVANADYIYVLKKGRIIEKGSYSELLQKNGEFRNMLELQVLEVKGQV